MGNGFQEVIYQRALQIEMKNEGLQFEGEHDMVIYYRDYEISKRRVDFLVEGCVMVELKALLQLEDVHYAQAITKLTRGFRHLYNLFRFSVLPNK